MHPCCCCWCYFFGCCFRWLMAKNTYERLVLLGRFQADKTHDDVSNILQQWKTNNQPQLQMQMHLQCNNEGKSLTHTDAPTDMETHCL